jgi:hypothetical protein
MRPASEKEGTMTRLYDLLSSYRLADWPTENRITPIGKGQSS